MNELIINNRRVDFSESTNIGITFCANNIGELQNRQGNFSNTFKLPITKINKEIFEWSHLQNSSSSMPYKKLKATYRQNGIEIVSDGVAEILNVDNDFFYVNIYSGNLDLMDAIGDITVGELYVNDSTIRWNIDDLMVELFYKPKYYTFPFIDWRLDNDTFFETTTIDVRQMLPCATIPDLFDRLTNQIGYIFKGNYFSSQNYLNMILTPNSFSIPKTDAVKSSQSLKYSNTEYTQISTGTSSSSVNYFPSFRNETNNPDFITGVFKPTVNKIGKLKFAGTYKLYFGHNVAPTFVKLKAKEAYVKAYITDISGLNIIYGPIIYGPYHYGLNEINFDIETPETTFTAGQTYKVKLTAYVDQTNKIQQLNLLDYDTDSSPNFPVFNRFLQFTPSPKIAYNTQLDFTKIFTMKVKDVLKDILNMQGIIIQTNNFTKTIQFNKFDDVILNKSISKDWSRKIQSSKSMSFKFGNYAKKNNVKFKNDTYNNWSFYLPNENLDVEKDVVKLNHDATFQYNKYNGFIIPSIDGLKDASNEWNNPSWRLLYINQQLTNFNVIYTDGSKNAIIETSYNKKLPFCYFKDANTLIDENYSGLFEILKNPKVLKIVANLDITDISDLDFSIPIQINRPDLNLSGYFYINKIENYKGGLTSCEIIEI